jgi:hypothetical protein
VVGPPGTPLAAKLGITPGSDLVLLGAPADLALELPAGVRVRRRAGGRADVVVVFVVERRRLGTRIDALASMVFPDGGLWVAWPKRSSSVTTDLTDGAVRELALPRGLVDNKVCAVDATWTALRLVWRVERRTVEG